MAGSQPVPYETLLGLGGKPVLLELGEVLRRLGHRRFLRISAITSKPLRSGSPRSRMTTSGFSKGEIVGYVREPSDVLAMFILKSRRKEIYGEHHQIEANINQNIALMTPEQRDQLPLALIEDLEAIAADARVIESDGG